MKKLINKNLLIITLFAGFTGNSIAGNNISRNFFSDSKTANEQLIGYFTGNYSGHKTLEELLKNGNIYPETINDAFFLAVSFNKSIKTLQTLLKTKKITLDTLKKSLKQAKTNKNEKIINLILFALISHDELRVIASFSQLRDKRALSNTNKKYKAAIFDPQNTSTTIYPGMTLTHITLDGNTQMIKWYLDKIKVNLNDLNKALIAGIQKGNLPTIKFLLEFMKKSKIIINPKSMNDGVQYAALGSRILVIKFLLEFMKKNKITIDYKSMDEAVKIAIRKSLESKKPEIVNGRLDIVKYLLIFMKKHKIEINKFTYMNLVTLAAKKGNLSFISESGN